MSTETLTRSLGERWLGLFAPVRAGEGRAVVLFMCYGFLVMFSYYVLKTMREPLLLSTATAETKSYAYALIALILLFVVPVYGSLYRRLPNRKLNLWIGGILLMFQALFSLMTWAGFEIGFAYYVWIGIFGVLITAQFWAFAADSFNVKTGQRIFPLIMIGVSLGGLVGPALAGRLFQVMDAHFLMLLVMAVLALMLPLNSYSRGAVPPLSRSQHPPAGQQDGTLVGGFAQVLHSPYLLLIACMVVLLNWVNTTGEYILAELVIVHADSLVAEDPTLDKGRIIGAFYGNFFSIVNGLSLLMQMFLVSRIIAWIGVHRALLILPIIAFVGYGLMVFVPVFSIIQLVKAAENASDYSLMSTSRQILFLPLTPTEKYQSKITIDAFFWRFGDLIQALVVYLGLNLLGFEVAQFAVMNMVLALVWIGLAIHIGRRYVSLKSMTTSGEPPRLLQQMQPRNAPPEEPLDYQLPPNLFHCEPGDILDYTVRAMEGEQLPGWLQFEAERLRFTGTPPKDQEMNTWVTLRATNLDGQWAETRIGFIHRRHW